MTNVQVITLGSDAPWSWASAIGLGIAILFLLIIAVAAIGFPFVHKDAGSLRHLWITGVVALAAAAVFAYRGHGLFTSVARIEVDRSGEWALYAPVGRLIARVAPDNLRSLHLWAEVNTYETAPYFDSLYGSIRIENEREYRLRISNAFDLLIRLGYGPYWIDHSNITAPEEKQARDAQARMLFAGTNKSEGVSLPIHTYTTDGIAQVRQFLSTRARQENGE
jgi:hypothetical protein